MGNSKSSAKKSYTNETYRKTDKYDIEVDTLLFQIQIFLGNKKKDFE